MTPGGRIEAAIALLGEALRVPGAPADAVAVRFFRCRRFIGAADRRAVSERVWRILRAHRRLAWWLEPTAPTARLLIGADLLLSGTGMADLRGLFNADRFAPEALAATEEAVLRRLDGHTLAHPAMPEAVRLEVPHWLLPHLAARFGEGLEAELAALGEPAPLDLRVNLLRGRREEALVALAGEGISAVPTPLSPVGIRVASRTRVTGGPAFRSGLVEIQDEGSQLVALLVGAQPEMRVADLCAGAGGKTLALAMAMRNRGRIVACDVSEPRLAAAARRFRRAGISTIERHLLDSAGNKWAKRSAGSFDRVLADAPCTGSGTWRRHPDARWRFEPAGLAELLKRQAAIMEFAARLVRKGGRLVYATCSLLLEENEAQVQSFLAHHPDFGLMPFAEAWKPLSFPPPCPGPFLFLTPLRHATDGFFAAVLERAA